MELQVRGWYAKLSSAINTTRNINGCTPVSRFGNNPRLMHTCAIRRIKKYVVRTSTYVNLPDEIRWLTTHGIVYRPSIEKGIKCYIYYDFDGEWDQVDTDNAEDFISRMRYVTTYTVCPLLWCRNVQR